MPILVGVDGGGTHTRACIATARGEVLAAVRTGSSNISINGFANAQREILAAIDRGLTEARVARTDVGALCFGLSGVDREPETGIFVRWAQDLFHAPTRVVNDGELVLAAGTPDAWGIAVIAGTGSIAFAKTRRGDTARAGGWGYLIGDEGSGGELGRAAVRAAAQAADGRGAPTQLLQAILTFWNLRAPSDLIGRVYRAQPDGMPLRPGDFASLAPQVLGVAEGGDAVAQELVTQTAHALVEHIVTLAHRLDFGTSPIPLALGGGLLVGSKRVQRELAQECAARGFDLAPTGLAPEPVLGAVKLARLVLERQGGPGSLRGGEKF